MNTSLFNQKISTFDLYFGIAFHPYVGTDLRNKTSIVIELLPMKDGINWRKLLLA